MTAAIELISVPLAWPTLGRASMDSDQTLIARTLQDELPRPGSSEQATLRTSATTHPYGPMTAWSDSETRHRFEAGCYRSLHNLALDARPKRPHVQAPAEPDTSPDDDPRRHSASELERRERPQRLEPKLRSLRPDHRSLLVLRDLEEMPTARYTTCPSGPVKGRPHRTRGELIDVLRNNTYDWKLSA